MRIYGFYNRVNPWEEGEAMAITGDGRIVAVHICSRESWAARDLGMTGQSTRHHRDYNKACPDGWQAEYVPHNQADTHEGLQAALKQNREERHGRQGN